MKLSSTIKEHSFHALKNINTKLDSKISSEQAENFVLYLFGSLAREEASYSFDQDSLLIFKDGLPLKEKILILKLIKETFEELGIKDCPEKMTFFYDDWNGEVSHWKLRLILWTHTPSAKYAINIASLSSAKAIYGNKHLFELSEEIKKQLNKNSLNLYVLFFINFFNLLSITKKHGAMRRIKDITDFHFLYKKNFCSRKTSKDLELLTQIGLLKPRQAQYLFDLFNRLTMMTYPKNLQSEKQIFLSFKDNIAIRLLGVKVYFHYFSKLLRTKTYL